MKTTLAARLRTARKLKGLSQKALGESVGISQAAIQKIEAGKAKETTKLLDLALALAVRPEWLSSGAGPMQSDISKSIQTKANVPPESEWGSVSPWDSNTPLEKDEVEVPFLRDIEFACGNGKVLDEDYNGFRLRFSKATLRRTGANSDGSGIICFPVTGPSMEPVIPDGATVAVDTGNKKIIDGEIYAINHGGLKRIKQLYRRPGGKLIIRSFNREEYEDEEVPEAEVEITGFVFWYSVLRCRR